MGILERPRTKLEPSESEIIYHGSFLSMTHLEGNNWSAKTSYMMVHPLASF